MKVKQINSQSDLISFWSRRFQRTYSARETGVMLQFSLIRQPGDFSMKVKQINSQSDLISFWSRRFQRTYSARETGVMQKLENTV